MLFKGSTDFSDHLSENFDPLRLSVNTSYFQIFYPENNAELNPTKASFREVLLIEGQCQFPL